MRGFLLLLGLTASLTATAETRAEAIDHAKVFTSAAVAQANKVLADVQAKHHSRVTVETFPEIPSDKRAEFDRARTNSSARDQFYMHWADERLKAHGGGVMVLINMKPGHVHVRMDRDAQNSGFTDRDRAALRNKFVGLLGEKKYDEALLNGVNLLRDQFAAQLPSPRPAEHHQADKPQKGIMDWLCPIIAIAIGAWIVLALIRAITGAGRSMGGQGFGGGPGYTGGGGGFFSNFLGGMFGAVAGNWMYNSFFGGSHFGGMGGGGFSGGSAFGADPSAGNDPDYGRDPGDNGGDFGDAGGDTGGGDFGGDAGGDFGGGDFGGGDFGGDAGGDY